MVLVTPHFFFFFKEMEISKYRVLNPWSFWSAMACVFLQKQQCVDDLIIWNDVVQTQNDLITRENIKKIPKIVLDNRKVKLQGVSSIFKIPRRLAVIILQENLSMRILSSQRVHRLLTINALLLIEIARIELWIAAPHTAFSKTSGACFKRKYLDQTRIWRHYWSVNDALRLRSEKHFK